MTTADAAQSLYWPPPARTPASSGSASGPLEGGQEPQDLLGLFSAFGHDAVTKSAISAQFNFVPARGTLFHEGTPAMAIHIVRTGTFKCCRVDTWGGERVLDFARRGDVLGYAALGRGHYTSSAVALEPATVVVVPIEDLFSWLQRLPALQRSLHHALSLQHARAEELSDVRAVLPAEVRLARFLLHWSARVAFSGQSMRQLKLAMSRRDIARLLGVAHETVSRAFGSLADRGCLVATGRTVDIRDPAALLAVAREPVAARQIGTCQEQCSGETGTPLHWAPRYVPKTKLMPQPIGRSKFSDVPAEKADFPGHGRALDSAGPNVPEEEDVRILMSSKIGDRFGAYKPGPRPQEHA